MVKQPRVWLFSLCLLALSSLAVRPVSAVAATDQPNVVYGKADDQELALDIYGADSTQKKPAIIFLHGGGWQAGSRHDMDVPASYFAQQGYVCFAVSYRLVKDGKNRYPAQIDDVQRAVRWIRAHATDYGVNPDKIGALGASAGGHLVALLGTTDTLHNTIPELADYSSRVQCVVDLYGPADFTAFPDAPVIDEAQRTEGMKLVTEFLGPLPESAPNYLEASPIKHIDKKTSPFLIFHGGKDALVPLSQSQQLDEALHKAGIESKLTVFPNAGHGYTEPDLLVQTAMGALEFFNRHLKQ
ncbi:dipeptidyl aminopeptidase 4 [Abditibacteriota bacterium]|nr:dipeptidyl aminopeptidase 4 [Abditibacteriota bacterium]